MEETKVGYALESQGQDSDKGDSEVMFIGQHYLDESQTSPKDLRRQNIAARNWSKEKSQRSRSRSRSGIKLFNLRGSRQGSAEKSPSRPTIKERFQSHYSLMETKKEGAQLEKEIQDLKSENDKLRKDWKDREVAVKQLKKDFILIKQDLSTYEANVARKVDLTDKAQQILTTMSLRLERIQTMAETGPTMQNFLADVLVDAEKIHDISTVKANKQDDTQTCDSLEIVRQAE